MKLSLELNLPVKTAKLITPNQIISKIEKLLPGCKVKVFTVENISLVFK